MKIFYVMAFLLFVLFLGSCGAPGTGTIKSLGLFDCGEEKVELFNDGSTVYYTSKYDQYMYRDGKVIADGRILVAADRTCFFKIANDNLVQDCGNSKKQECRRIVENK